MPDNNAQEDLLKAVSDFLKGKSGFPNTDMAKLAFDGTGNITLPEFDGSPTFGKIAAQYPAVISALKKYALFHVAASFGGMLTLPELQGNNIRLDALTHLSVLVAQGKERPTPARISVWFNQMDSGICSRLEDSAEDVFIGNVYDKFGNYRLFEGAAESNSFQVQIFLNVLGAMPDEGWCTQLKHAVCALLKLSDAVAEKCGLEKYVVGNSSPVATLPKASPEILAQVKQRVVFSVRELAELEINVSDLSPFIFDENNIAIIADCTFGDTPLEACPLIQSGEKIVVALPNAIGLAVRRVIIESCIEYGMREIFEEALSRAYAKFLYSEPLLGKFRKVPVYFQKHDGIFGSNVVLEVDEGRYFHFIFFCDGLSDYESTSFAGTNFSEAATGYVAESIGAAKKDFLVRKGFKEAISLVIGCGWGRGFGAGILVDEEANWRILPMPVYDLCTLSRKYDFRPLDLFRILDASDAIKKQGIEIVNANGFLNLYAWIESNKGHIVPHEKLDADFCSDERSAFLTIPMNGLLSLRQEALNSVDMHIVQLPTGAHVLVRRTHASPRYGTREFKPCYADVFALERRLFRSVYKNGSASCFWIEVPTDTKLDSNTTYHLGMMMLHWAECVSRAFSEIKAFSTAHFLWRVTFEDDKLPTYEDALPSAEVVKALAVYTIDTQKAQINVVIKKGFLLACRLAENTAEATIVRALVASGNEYVSSGASEDEITRLTQNIVADVGARHFHVFATHDIRDYVRENLPERGQIISKLDDAESRIGLGWLVRERSAGDMIEGRKLCCEYLSALVKAIGNEIRRELVKFNRINTITKLLINYEALFAESQHWMRTFRAVRAISDDPQHALKQATDNLTSFNAGSLASRILIEMAICECPLEGGTKAGKRDLGRLMAMTCQIFYYGGYSDAMNAEIMEAVIKLSPAGDVLMKHDFTDNTVRPLGETYQHVSLSDAAAKYQENYLDNDELDKESEDASASIEEVFATAWQAEFGFTLDSIKAFGEFFKTYAAETRQPILNIKRSELFALVEAKTILSKETLTAIFNAFTLGPRPKWDESPEGVLPNAWHPWRFRRQLSLISRPLIQLDTSEDPLYMIAPAMIVHHLSKFIGDVLYGRLDEAFFRKDGLLAKWIGRINHERGEAFNERVAKKFRENGWNAEANLTDGKLLNRQKNERFGDVDVLAWYPETGRILVIECKDLSFDKTFGEIARRMAKYRGLASEGGKKRDELRRHLDRYEELKQNVDKLAEFTKCPIKKIEAVLVFSTSTPMQFDEKIAKLNVNAISVDEVSKHYTIVKEPVPFDEN